MNVEIRRAEARDVPRMLELVKELALFEKAPEAVTVTEAGMHDAGFGPAPVWVGWVAEERSDDRIRRGSDDEATAGTVPLSDHPIHSSSERILGMAICYERYSTWKGRRLYLEDIVVTEAARGQRIGERLFRACAAHAVEQGHSGMLWQVLDWNTDAMRFYDRFGASYSDEWRNASLERARLEALVAEPWKP